ncbi:uroporphyrinogen decarboxylase family protein [Prolixibacteraceae bacterium Z1-6]|uniref:Uroporphyrinogen decarboxylase family protein n=1 Tax=Draconibacterium aestuarii TaxID=2998507 RepID=A0A9X3F9X8_9BACT|nr:uroporphyrinogen decarboxylase family protein [Prolixibacteraceae bacterium Z1-6]
MNGYQRIQAALKGEKSDKIPIMLHNFMMAAEEAGISMATYRNNPKMIAEVFIKSIEKYEYDGVLVDLDTVTLAGAVGVPVDFPEHEPARSAMGNMQLLEDVKKLKKVNIEHYKYVENWLEATRLLKDRFKNEVFVRGNCDQAPFSLASMMRGSQEWMLDLIMGDSSLVLELLEYCTDITCQFIELMAQTGCDMVSNGDSPAGPEMISPDMYEMFALQYEKKVVETAHNNHLPYLLHICGNTDTILELMLQTDSDAFELDYKTNAQKAFDVFHNKACFVGNVDPSGVLALGTPAMVEKKTLELLEVFSKTNRFILNAGCALPSSTPEENLRMMIKTARNN